MVESSENARITTESYDATADGYAAKVLGIDVSHQMDKFLGFMPKHRNRISVILDVGCGPGRDAKDFTERGYTVMGIDLSERFLEKARQHAPRAVFRKRSLLDLPDPTGWYDGVWAMSVLMHLEKAVLAKGLGELHRVLKQDAPIYMSFKRGEGEGLELDQRFNVRKYFAYYRDDEIYDIVTANGFRILDFERLTSGAAYATKPWMDIYAVKG